MANHSDETGNRDMSDDDAHDAEASHAHDMAQAAEVYGAAECDDDDTAEASHTADAKASHTTTEERLNTLVYVAGPYSGDVAGNVERAREVGRQLIEAGYSVLVPHLLGYPGTQDERWWYAATLAMMLRCDCVFVVRGWVCSAGARNEVCTMWERNQSVYNTIEHDGSLSLSPNGREEIAAVLRGARARRMFPVYGQTVVW